MRFAGHQTFPIREGWLHKGLDLLINDQDLLLDEYAADWLGVGKNMAKAINFWLMATGLGQGKLYGRNRKDSVLDPSELGCVVYEHDPYFLEPATWWVLHVNLVNAPDHAASWVWFFNHFNLARFERAVCVESLNRYMQISSGRTPAFSTMKRDIGCLLSSYARTIPDEQKDPEEARECPFRELGLLSYFRGSGYYQLDQGVKDIPWQVFGYAVAKAFPDASEGEGTIDITISDLAKQNGGPGKAFALTRETLFELALRCEAEAPEDEFQVVGLASDKVVRLDRREPLAWLDHYYEALEEERSRHAA